MKRPKERQQMLLPSQPTNLPELSTENLSATACGKTILVGEHSVVYNYKAVAMALPAIKLNLTLLKNCSKNPPSNWENAFKVYIHGKETVPEKRVLEKLKYAFESALKIIGMNLPLDHFKPQTLMIDSTIPLGGGMGGSAAISTCFIRIASQIMNKNLSLEEEIRLANEIDSHFHNGKASGLDVSAVASNGIILFQKNSPIHTIKNKCSFWIALIDSEERSETSIMIQKVKKEMDENSKKVELIFQQLNEIAIKIANYLKDGALQNFAQSLNEAHSLLQSLGVSTTKIDDIVTKVKKMGALGAKLTGAGGGGLVLAIFSEQPEHLRQEFPEHSLYFTAI